MTKKEFLKKVAELRSMKKSLLAWSKEPWATPIYNEQVHSFCALIPSKNADLSWKNDDDFESVYKVFYVQFDHLTLLKDRLIKVYEESIAPIVVPATVVQQEPDVPFVPDSEPTSDLDSVQSDFVPDGQMKLEMRGGARKGAGRPSKGIKKPVSITIPKEEWDLIDKCIAEGHYKTYADYFRHAHHILLKRVEKTFGAGDE